ncbi:MAG: M23 family metallopeptidase [Chloroflexota bacterium]
MIRFAPIAVILLLMAGCAATGVPMRPDELQWWWSNQDPPEILLSGPGSAVRSRTSIQVTLRPADRASLITASLDGQDVPPESPLVIETALLPDGQHTMNVVAEDRSRRKNRSDASITFLSDNTPPSLTWDIQPQSIIQGSAAVIRLRSNEPTAVEVTADTQIVPLNVGNGYAWTIMSFGPLAPIGDRSLNIVGRDEAGNESRSPAAISVGRGRFVSEDVQVPAALARLLTPEFRAQEESKLAEIYGRSTGPPQWRGQFRVPTDGAIVTEFGTERAYNGGPLVGHHAGVDIAAPAGAPVLAAQSGRVALVDELTVRGNTLVLDHGHGVYTTYAHLQEILVPPNALVDAGQRVARVGNTGLSTGPHLHWEVWVGGANVEPIAWTRLDLP